MSIWATTPEGCYFGGICQRQCHYEFNTVFRKSCNVLCAKPKEVDPIKLNFSMKTKCFKYVITNGTIKKKNGIGYGLSEKLKISLPAITFYRQNDTQTFVI